MSDNGKTPEQIKADKFTENPDQFIDTEELILAVRRGSEGKVETLIGAVQRQELEVALMRITHQVYGIFNAMSYENQKQSGIIKPKGGVMDFVRRKKR